MLGKALCLSLGLFLCGSVQATEEKLPGTVEQIQSELETKRQNAADRTDPLPEPTAPSQPVVRCARGVYSFDCAAPKAVMRADVSVLDHKFSCSLRNFLSPGWRCE